MCEATDGVRREIAIDENQIFNEIDGLFARCADLEDCLDTVTALLVGAICDGCVIDVLDEEGRLAATGVEHVDSELEKKAGEILTPPREPIGAEGQHLDLRQSRPWRWTRKRGQSVADRREAKTLTGEMCDELDLQSMIVVSLQGPGQPVAVLTLLMTDGEASRYEKKRLKVAGQLGQRLAPVIYGFWCRRHLRSSRTEMVDTERQLAMTKAVTQHLGEGTVAVDGDGSVIFANPAASRLLGYETTDELLGTCFHDLVHGDGNCDDLHRCVLLLGETTGADIQSQDDEFIKRSGTRIPVAYTRTRLGADDDTDCGAVIVFRDMSNYRNMLAQLLSTDRMVAVGTLAAGIAHEINNPLAFVQANMRFVLQVLEARGREPDESVPPGRSADDQSLRESLLDGMEGIERIRAIVAGMQTFTGGQTEYGRVDVEKCLDDALMVCHGRIKRFADIERRGDRLVAIQANPSQITQIFVNLLLNAANAIGDTAEHGTIVIVTECSEDRQFVEIKDDGVGFDDELKKQIFDPFFTTRDVGGGTGLGLFICRAIVRELGGTIKVESTPGEGTSFCVMLPVENSDDGSG